MNPTNKRREELERAAEERREEIEHPETQRRPDPAGTFNPTEGVAPHGAGVQDREEEPRRGGRR